MAVVASALATASPAEAHDPTDRAIRERNELALISRIMNRYTVNGNVTYKSVNGWEGKLDVYSPRDLKSPNPTVVYYHGGGWTVGTKEERSLLLLPYMLKGWTVVNVEYRVSSQALAPAAAEDAWCALQWVFDNANTSFQSSTGPTPYLFDTTRIVTTGTSAGGHLALLVGMAPPSAGLGKDCPSTRQSDRKVAAIVDWFGITDVGELRGKPGEDSLGGRWIGIQSNGDQIARQVSPVTYVRKDVPPIISLHGDMDTGVPYAQKQRFHELLQQAGADHKLITIKGGGHGIFKPEDNLDGYQAIWDFLAARGLEPATGN